MTNFLTAIAPGVALGTAALGLVATFDRALQPAQETTARSAGDASGGSQAASGCSAATTYTGDTVMTRWGPVQVEATVGADGTICSSQALVYPTGDGESISINNQALPIIERSVAAQGIAFDSVSGATVTSEGYRESLQSVLDQL